eukprot:m.175913 g.175913  ORF g.175913 m.175913 type:complete len:488 (-) comp13525_c1_seq1:36-1499(-)
MLKHESYELKDTRLLRDNDNDYDSMSSSLRGSMYTDGEEEWSDDEGDGEFDHLRAPKETSWLHTAAIIFANIVGVGILGLPKAFSQLGWALSFGVVVAIALLSTYSSLILAWLRGIHKHITTYPGLAVHVSSYKGERVSKVYKRIIQAILFAYLQGICTVYLSTIKLSLEQIFQKCDAEVANSEQAFCEPQGCNDHAVANLPDTLWLVIGALCVFPFVHFRRLANALWLYAISVATIVAVVAIIIYRCVVEYNDNSWHPTFEVIGDSFPDIVNGIVTIVFAFGGHSVLLDIISEMKDVSHFPKSVYLSQGALFACYAVIGFVGFGAFGVDVPAPITLAFPRDHLNIVTNVLLLVHVTVAYCINSTVFVKNVFKMVWPKLYMSEFHRREKALRWGFLATIVLLLSFTISVIVPYFQDIMNLYSAVSVFSLSVWVPPFLFLEGRRHTMSTLLLIANVLIVCIGIAGMCLGVWAAIDDVVRKVKDCALRA